VPSHAASTGRSGARAVEPIPDAAARLFYGGLFKFHPGISGAPLECADTT